MLRYVVGLALLALALAMGVAGSARAAAPLLDISNGDLRLVLERGTQKRLYVRGVPVLTESHVFIVKPRWLGSYVNTEEMEPKVTTSKEGDVVVGVADYTRADAWAKVRYELHPDNTFRMVLSYGTKEPAEMESASFINANVLEGAHYVAETKEGRQEGDISTVPAPTEMANKPMMPMFKRLTLNTRLGEIDITTQGDRDEDTWYKMFDSRAGKSDWALRHPIFWFGYTLGEVPIQEAPQTSAVTFAFRLKPAVAAAPTVEAAPKVTRQKLARTPAVPELPVIPHPKRMTVAGEPLRLTSAARIRLGDDPTPEEAAAARALQSELKTFWHLSVPIVQRPGKAKASGAEIVLAVRGRGPLDAEAASNTPDAPEGYYLRVRGNKALIAGNDPRGLYDGAQTLKQLLRVDERGVYLKPATIRDWPSLSMRGVHWFGGPKGRAFHARMIDRILAPLKMNTMVYEVEWAHWDSQPKLHSKYGESKADVKATVDTARAHFIEPIPVVQSLGHSDWLFENKQNLEYATNPEKPYTYDPTKPGVYAPVFSVMQEAIDLFHPKYFHIGHDEVSGDSNWPPKGQDKTAEELFVQDTKKVHDWLAARGIRTMMWGDMMLHFPEEAADAANASSLDAAKKMRAELPKDITIADWHYFVGGQNYPNVPIFQKDGFDVVGATWFDWPTIQGFARALSDNKSLGLIQTTWAGYEMSPELVKTGALLQFVAYLVGAEYAWNGGSIALDDLGYNPDEAFRYLWDRAPVDMKQAPGFTVDLSPFANADLPVAGFSASGTTRLAGTLFAVGRPVRLRGSLDETARPRALDLALGGRTASALHLLWGADAPTPRGTRVATFAVTYADGKTVEVPVNYGEQIYAFSDTRGGEGTTTVWRGRTPAGLPATLRRWAWTNPRPTEPIARVTLTSAGTEAAPLVLGLTGIGPVSH